MQYISLKDSNHKASFREAVLRGIAPEKGLYFPEYIPKLDPSILENIQDYSNHDLAYEAIKLLIGNEIPETDLKQLIANTLSFPFEIAQITDNIHTLELFHGPTMAFKDVGAKFMAQCVGYFSGTEQKKTTILVSTSGDTGGAVGNGFKGVPGVEVVILYPSGKVSQIQEKQMTTIGDNVFALEVDGNFDLCQDMVKQAFMDEEIQQHRNLNSANSINVARWMSQSFYYLIAYKHLKDLPKPLIFCVPSGNLGNVAAGMLARHMGLPIDHFIVANNANDTLTRYMQTQQYNPQQSIPTISNAMDITDPSNFPRVLKLWNEDFELIKQNLSGYSFSDDQCKQAVLKVQQDYGYLMDPHGAIGYLGLKQHLQTHDLKDCTGVFLETAHPAKFKETMEDILQTEIPLPQQLQGLMSLPKQSQSIKNYDEFKQFLIQ